MTEANITRYAKLPTDDWYDASVWEEILGGDEAYGERKNVSTFDPTQVAHVELWHVEEGTWGPEHSACGLFLMEDGTYVVYSGWCDSTGWTCRSGAYFTHHPTRADAERFGFEDEHRSWFGITLPETPEGP